ncbi:regulator of telomere elongation helicase 1 homolog [Teleopsis dalmanni]|uniref:regulator of telomere elongation helicase 1 homolog n=1 Tax=Teleopsis dalmanni TaxID=139649 RepID=UPI0018CCE28D|nr:regulator of telomere elongation helicase 1 homolog [Teleopsis dalmanni]
MPEYMIGDVSVNFPFEPYDVQKAYMEKVIICLKDGTNGVLESPTGTGKTLSLLCSSLAWILSRKNDLKHELIKQCKEPNFKNVNNEIAVSFMGGSSNASKKGNWGVPKIIYASRTHSQLTQAMQELKRTAYSFMRAVVLGSRDQLCIHPEVMREQGNSNKVQMCKLRVQTKTCSFHTRVDSKKDHPDLRGPTIMDIEDLVKVGQKLKICPYYASKELVDDADITFMPYNYLLDPKARKANKIELKNTIIILDEAHNIEKICEESASVQIRSSDIAQSIDDVTHIMKAFSNGDGQDMEDETKDFTIEDLALLKEMLLGLEQAVDDITVDNRVDGQTYPASYIFEVLAKANFGQSTAGTVAALLEKLIQFLAVETTNSVFRKGGSFQILSDLLNVVFMHKEENMEKLLRSFKLHVQIEETKQQTARGGTNKDGWLSKVGAAKSSSKAKVINFWCFNPGFGMEELLNKNVRSIILTSGTLAPLKPLIAELAVPVAQHLENPHIVNKSQVYVKIIGTGPDREQLISNFANRNNPKYISSLGQTILNVSRIVPDGLLVFFPSYPLLNQCVDSWQASGLWSDLSRHKPIFVEPRTKESFTTTMEEFYQAIRDSKGACFMAVCRGKVSEGLDFADRNGRAVIITGLPYPPFKDPKVILKRRYLEDNRTKENELLSGQEWYGLDATRAVNQAIGRVIRHRHDYGAILLCDMRFQQQSQVQQLSKWIRGHLGPSPKSSNFGPILRELREFYKNADKNTPKPVERSVENLVKESLEDEEIVRSKYFSDPTQSMESKQKYHTAQNNAIKLESTNSIQSWSPADYAAAAGRTSSSQAPTAMDFISRLDTNVKTIDFNSSSDAGLVKIHKRERSSPSTLNNNLNISEMNKKKRYKLVENSSITTSPSLFSSSSSSSCASESSSLDNNKEAPENRVEFLRVLRSSLSPENFAAFTAALISYKRDNTFDALMTLLMDILGKPHLLYMLRGMRRFLKNEHKSQFDDRLSCIS